MLFDCKENAKKKSKEIFEQTGKKRRNRIETRIIRDHWGIENKNHYVKDVSMNEDNSRIRKNPHIFASLRTISLNILRANKVKNIKNKLFQNGCNLDRMFKLII